MTIITSVSVVNKVHPASPCVYKAEKAPRNARLAYQVLSFVLLYVAFQSTAYAVSASSVEVCDLYMYVFYVGSG